ncbi:MAG TPA: molybdopterin-dependent oxidoreductase [Trebonia sp.]
MDVRLTAEDGYSAQRSYSIASAADGARLELTVQRLPDGEVSPYLAGSLVVGQQLELRGPIGGWFAWPPGDPRPLLLLAGGSGIVPLMSMIRTHEAVQGKNQVRLIYSARTPDDVIYAGELSERSRVSPLIVVTCLYTRLTRWRGVSLDTLLDGVETRAGYALARSYGGYTTNLPLPDLRDGKAWIAYSYDGRPLPPEHGGPARLLVPHLYFWKSAKWVTGLDLMTSDQRGFWEQLGYHDYGDPWREQRYQGD